MIEVGATVKSVYGRTVRTVTAYIGGHAILASLDGKVAKSITVEELGRHWRAV